MHQWLEAGRTETGDCPLCKAPLLIEGVPVSQLMAAQFDALYNAGSANRGAQSEGNGRNGWPDLEAADRALAAELEVCGLP